MVWDDNSAVAIRMAIYTQYPLAYASSQQGLPEIISMCGLCFFKNWSALKAGASRSYIALTYTHLEHKLMHSHTWIVQHMAGVPHAAVWEWWRDERAVTEARTKHIQRALPGRELICLTKI